MKRFLAALLLFAASALPAAAQSYSDIDVDLPAFPEMQPVPNSPVYWAPGVDSNYFFYDGLFWDFNHDMWHWSAWYNGPWAVADPVYVPTYVLWVPIYYYRKTPHYFRSWKPDRPPGIHSPLGERSSSVESPPWRRNDSILLACTPS